MLSISPRWLSSLFCAGIMLASPLLSQADYSSLPEMGDRSTTVLDAVTSAQIGESMMKQIQRTGKINDDPVVNDYIERIGRRLASAAMAGGQSFHFFAINENSINAFAMPGGYIGVHTGLILASKSENELAAVIAHEIAHVSQHHIARSVEKAQQMNLPLTAAVIAAILLGASDPQLANAALAASMGVGQQVQIDFTHANEKEADRVGMQLLHSAGFDPRGMADFFLRLQQDSRFSSNSVPEFLRTHPITSDRLAEAQERAERYPPAQHTDQANYQLVQARLHLLHTDSVERLKQQVVNRDSRLNLSDEAMRYLQALIHQQQQQHTEANALFQGLLQDNPERIAYIDALARLKLATQEYDAAAKLYRRGLNSYPDNRQLTMGLSNALITANEFTAARQLLLDHLSRLQTRTAPALRELARAEAALGNHVASHIALAEYYLLINEPHSALNQLTTARRQQPIDDYHAARIEAYTEQVQERLKK